MADGQRKVPRGLARAIAKRVKSVAAGHLKEAGAKAYAASGAPSYNSALAATAFMAHRSPAVYAATERVLDEMVTKLPSDILADVRSSIDFGAGSCASTWALNQVLPQAMDEGLVVVEPSPHMMDAGLATLPDDAALHSRISARVTLPSTPADLVLASYVLCDLPSDNLLAPTIDQLWAAAGKVLVVEDDQISQIMACVMIQELGFDVLAAANGAEALVLLEQHARAFDIVIMDCQMPVMDGFECTRAIRDLELRNGYERLPILACTSKTARAQMAMCTISGMDDVMNKPINEDILRHMLNLWMRPDFRHRTQMAYYARRGSLNLHVDSIDDITLANHDELTDHFIEKNEDARVVAAAASEHVPVWAASISLRSRSMKVSTTRVFVSGRRSHTSWRISPRLTALPRRACRRTSRPSSLAVSAERWPSRSTSKRSGCTVQSPIRKLAVSGARGTVRRSSVRTRASRTGSENGLVR